MIDTIPAFFMACAAFCSGIVLCAGTAALTVRAVPESISQLEKFTRNRWIGMILGWIVLALCVPHAVVVSPGFLLPLLWPLAVIVPILGFFYVDYPCARSLGGAFILLGYYFVHFTFDFHTPGAPVLAVAGWLIGIVGIWVSGKPCALRDYFRMAASNKKFRLICTGAWSVCTLLFLWALVMTRQGGVQ